MSRTVISMNCRSLEGTKEYAESVLVGNGYRKVTHGEETVWRKTSGFFARKYIKLEYEKPNTAVVSGWVESSRGGEQAIRGSLCFFSKRQVRNIMQLILMGAR